ncbi:MAG: nuclear transport factor 2 family protein, partial [Acetobacteraceae bacterium]
MSVHRRHVATAGAGVLAAAAFGLLTPASAGSKKDAASLAAAVESFREAMLKADKAAFETLCSKNLSYGHSGGRIETKQEFIAGSTSGKSRWKTLAFNNVT